MWCLVCLSGSPMELKKKYLSFAFLVPSFCNNMHHPTKVGWPPHFQCIRQSFRLLQLWPAGRLSFCNFSNSGPSFLHHPRRREYYNEQDLEYYSPTEQKYNLLPIDWFSWDPPLEMLATAFFISPKNIQNFPRLGRLDKGNVLVGQQTMAGQTNFQMVLIFCVYLPVTINQDWIHLLSLACTSFNFERRRSWISWKAWKAFECLRISVGASNLHFHKRGFGKQFRTLLKFLFAPDMNNVHGNWNKQRAEVLEF